METHNFHLYIGSKAAIATDLQIFSCKKIVSIYPSAVKSAKKAPIITIDNGGIEVEFYLEEFKLLLRPLNTMTDEEAKEYREFDNYSRPAFGHQSHWIEREKWDIENSARKVEWLIKNGFTVGLVPRNKFNFTNKATQQL